MKIKDFDDASVEISGLGAVLFCLSSAVKSSETPTEEILSEAEFFLSRRAYEISEAIDNLSVEYMKERKQKNNGDRI